MTSWVTFLRWITGQNPALTAVNFSHAQPAELSEYERIFRCVVHFDQPMVELIFPEPWREKIRQDMAHYSTSNADSVINKWTEATAVRADGTGFPIELALIPIQLNRFLIFTAIIRNITKRKRAEKSLKAYSEQLEEMVGARTNELTEGRIYDLGEGVEGVKKEPKGPLTQAKRKCRRWLNPSSLQGMPTPWKRC